MGALDLYQIRYLHFPSIRTARRRLEVLAERKSINRVRPSMDVPFHYWIGKKPGQLEHRIGVNYTRLFLQKWEKSLQSWEYEPQYYDILRPDGFATVKTGNELSCYFIEFDRCFDPFDKVQKYNLLYSSREFAEAWWAKSVKRFPVILVVSEDVDRAKKGLKDNKHNLEFRIMDYRQIKEGFMC
jgi:hypothetical protein